jgi:hypothetical protein
MFKFLKYLFTPEWATFNFGGGGGGGSQPTSTQTTSTTVPKYLEPNVQRMAGQAEALANAPYIPYTGERTAGFSDLQNQAFQEAQNLGPAQQLGTGTQLAGMAGLGSLQAGQNYQNMATNPNAMQSYMSPYIQGALNPQLQEARRQSDLTAQQNASQAVKAGAFGGSRFGIQEAERQRNLGTLQNQIYGTGMQNAFQNAQQAQQFGATLGLQGYGQGLQAANTLGQLGQAQFGQQQSAMQARAAAGQQQQALEQQKLQQQYQDFLDQRGYQQKQLGWLSDIYHGIPGAQTAQTQWQAPASPWATAGGLLATYAGAQKAFAGGGLTGLALHNMAKDK